jgi:hypothetical protein
MPPEPPEPPEPPLPPDPPAPPVPPEPPVPPSWDFFPPLGLQAGRTSATAKIVAAKRQVVICDGNDCKQCARRRRVSIQVLACAALPPPLPTRAWVWPFRYRAPPLRDLDRDVPSPDRERYMTNGDDIWRDLLARMRADPRLEVVAASSTELRVTMNQRDSVLATRFVVEGREWALYRSRISPQAELDVQAVMERNGRLALSTIVLVDGEFWFQAAIPLSFVVEKEPFAWLALVIDGARQLRPAPTPMSAGSAEHFAYWAE